MQLDTPGGAGAFGAQREEAPRELFKDAESENAFYPRLVAGWRAYDSVFVDALDAAVPAQDEGDQVRKAKQKAIEIRGFVHGTLGNHDILQSEDFMRRFTKEFNKAWVLDCHTLNLTIDNVAEMLAAGLFRGGLRHVDVYVMVSTAVTRCSSVYVCEQGDAVRNELRRKERSRRRRGRRHDSSDSDSSSDGSDSSDGKQRKNKKDKDPVRSIRRARAAAGAATSAHRERSSSKGRRAAPGKP